VGRFSEMVQAPGTWRRMTNFCSEQRQTCDCKLRHFRSTIEYEMWLGGQNVGIVDKLSNRASPFLK
jgi:hypothetical protein